jgi:hypothetical protein
MPGTSLLVAGDPGYDVFTLFVVPTTSQASAALSPGSVEVTSVTGDPNPTNNQTTLKRMLHLVYLPLTRQ